MQKLFRQHVRVNFAREVQLVFDLDCDRPVFAIDPVILLGKQVPEVHRNHGVVMWLEGEDELGLVVFIGFLV